MLYFWAAKGVAPLKFCLYTLEGITCFYRGLRGKVDTGTCDTDVATAKNLDSSRDLQLGACLTLIAFLEYKPGMKHSNYLWEQLQQTAPVMRAGISSEFGFP